MLSPSFQSDIEDVDLLSRTFLDNPLLALKQTLEPLTGNERAEQVAREVLRRFALDPIAGLEFLREQFIRGGWGNRRIAIEKLLAFGATIAELSVAADVRDWWREHPKLWTRRTNRGREVFYRRRHPVLSWQFAVTLAQTHADFDEVTEAVELLYEAWFESAELRVDQPSFHGFLLDRFAP